MITLSVSMTAAKKSKIQLKSSRTDKAVPVRPPRLTWLRNRQELAQRLNVTTAAVAQWGASERWIFGRGSLPLEWVRAWREQVFRNPKLSAYDDELKQRRLEKIDLEVKRLKHSMIDRSVFERGICGLIQMFCRELDDMLQSVPVQIQGLDAGAVERVLSARIDLMRDRLRSRGVIELSTVEQVEQMKARR